MFCFKKDGGRFRSFVAVLFSFLFTVLFFLTAHSSVYAATYYIRNDGNDALCSGLTDASDPSSGEAGQSCAWKTIDKVNRSSFSAGDLILFRKGDVWKEQLTVPSSGTSGNPITFGAYGTGADPIIDGSDIITGWNRNTVLTYEIAQEFDDASDYGGSELYNASSDVALSSSGGAAWNSGFRFQNIAVPRDAAITRATIQVFPYPDKNSITATLYGENTDNSVNFSANNPYPKDRVKTAASLPWVQTTDNWWASEDITAVVQEIVSRPGWRSGNALTILSTSRPNTTEAKVRAFSADRGAYRPKLTIEYASSEGNLWHASVIPQADIWRLRGPTQLWRDGVFGSFVAQKSGLDTEGEWYFDPDHFLLYYYSAADLTASAMQISVRPYAIKIGNDKIQRGNITINDLSARRANLFGIDVSYSNHVILNKIDAYQNSSTGVMVQYGSQTVDIIKGTVRENGHSRYNYDLYPTGMQDDNNGIGLGGEGVSSVDIKIDGVDLSRNVQDAVSIYIPGQVTGPAPNVIVKNCKMHDTTAGAGLGMDGMGQWGGFYNNLIYNNAYGGIFHEDKTYGTPNTATRLDIYNNVVYSNGHDGIKLKGRMTVANIKNNILYGNGDSWDYYDFLIGEDVNIDNIVSDFNIYYHPVSLPGTRSHSNFFYINNSPPNLTFSQWKTITGKDSHSKDLDPLFVNAASGDFTPLPSSAAIDAGTNVGLSSDHTGTSIPQGEGPDIGVYEYIFSVPTPINTSTPTNPPICPAHCANESDRSMGDADCNGLVEENDFGIWLYQYIHNTSIPSLDKTANFNCVEGQQDTYPVDLDDFQDRILINFGKASR